jgi:tRNA (guanine-N7-)-methyltransferase
MGRRALQKVDSGLDLRGWLLEEVGLADQLVPELVFGRQAPLEIEVGSGKGLFLARVTLDQPGHDFLGIEISGKYARYAAAQLARHGVVNGQVIHGDAVRIFRQRLADASAVAVHVYFPDPWWKHRHRKRRVMNAGFLADVVRVLCPGGVLHFWTDVREYYETTLDLIRQTTRLQGPRIPAQQPSEHDLDYRTHFERRMRLHDQPIYRAEFHSPARAQP